MAIKLSAEVIAGIKERMLKAQIAQTELQHYLNGCLQGMGLKGDWDINTDTWTVSKKVVKK